MKLERITIRRVLFRSRESEPQYVGEASFRSENGILEVKLSSDAVRELLNLAGKHLPDALVNAVEDIHYEPPTIGSHEEESE